MDDESAEKNDNRGSDSQPLRSRSSRDKASKFKEIMESLAPKSRSANPGLPISKKRKNTISVTATNKTTRSKSNKKKKASPEKCVLDNNSKMDGSGTIAMPAASAKLLIENRGNAAISATVLGTDVNPSTSSSTGASDKKSNDGKPTPSRAAEARRNTTLDSQKLKSLVRSAIADELPNAIKISQIAFAESAKKYSIMNNEEKTWPSYILQDPFAKPSDDGNTIVCSACYGIGRVKGKIHMRYPFSTTNWDGKYGHINTKGHLNAVANIEAESETNNIMGKKQITNILNYFTVKKKSESSNEKNLPETRKRIADSTNVVSVISIEQNDKDENRIVVGSKKR